jgi:hypothetical protein
MVDADYSLDSESESELLLLMDHFLVLDHWKILQVEYDIARELRGKLENREDFTRRDCCNALLLVNKVFDISGEIPASQFRWREDDYLQVALVLEDLTQRVLL